jgi:hypothetical protein
MTRLSFARILFGAAALSLAAHSVTGWAQPAPGSLLGSTGNSTNELVLIDPSTGASTFLADIGSQGPVTEIEFRADGTLFGATGQGTSNIIIIDPATGGETIVGQHAFGAVNGLEFIGNTLYGSFFAAGGPLGGPGGGYELVEVNQTDGTLTTIGPLPYGPVRGLAYDPVAGVLYGSGVPAAAPNGQLGGESLFTIDPSTGATTEIGPLGASLGAIEFGPDGTLYGGAANGGAPNGEGVAGVAATLYEINTSTGAATPVGPTNVPALSGLSFVPAGVPVPQSVGVPTLGFTGMAILIALFAGLGIAVVRRGF